MAAQEEVTLVIRARDRTRNAFRSVRRQIGRIGRALAGIAAVGLAALGAGAVSAARRFERLANAVRLLGVDLRELQAVQFLARDFGIQADEVVDLLDEIRARAGEALEPEGGEARDAFERLGFSADDLRQGPIRILEQLSDRISESTLSANELAAVLDQIGSDPARRLLPLLRQGNLRGRVQDVAGSERVADAETVRLGAEAVTQAAQALTEAQNRSANVFVDRVIPALNGLLQVNLGTRATLEVLQAIRRNTESGGTLE